MGEDNVKLKLELMQVLLSDEDGLNDVKKFIYERYGDIARLYNNINDEDANNIISNNKECFRIMQSKAIYMWVLADAVKRSRHFKEEASNTPELLGLVSSAHAMGTGISNVIKLAGKSMDVNSLDQIHMAMEMFEEDDGYFGDAVENMGYEDGATGEHKIESKEKDEYYKDEDTISKQENEWEPEIIANTARVIAVYRDLFEVGFELQVPYGILTKEGSIRLDGREQTIVNSVVSLGRIYKLIDNITKGYLIQSEISNGVNSDKLRNIKIRKGTTYYPEFQLGNLYGILRDRRIDNWGELIRELEPEIKSNIRYNISEGKDISSIVDALTTCIVISEFKPDVVLKLRINIGSRLLNKDEFERVYGRNRNSIFAGTGELYYINNMESGVVEVAIVFNKAAYNGRPLFAYEAVLDQQRRGRIPRTSEMILGQDVSGKILTTNLDRQNASILLVGAGQRSGKGVLTLNILGTVLADGHPVVYLDGKPDMAPVLWDVGKKNGLNPAVWDAFNSNGNILGVGAPEGIIKNNFDLLGLLAYLKVLQLMMLLAHLRATREIYVGGADKRPFFIFDEALAVQQALSGAWHGIIGMAKDKKDNSEDAQWCRGIVTWAEKMSNNLASTINSQLPKSGISTIWLFQAIQPTTWNQYKTEGMYKPFAILSHPLMSRMSIKLLGRGTADSEYGLSKVAADPIVGDRVLSDGGRHFAYTESQKINDVKTIKIFKPYLVLNNADADSKEVNELKNNVSREVWDVIAPEGYLHKGVGFEGFANLIGGEAIQNLESGRKMLEELLQLIGMGDVYESVDDYIYDASIESFIDLGEMLSRIENQYNNSSTESYYYSEGNGESADGLINPFSNDGEYNAEINDTGENMDTDLSIRVETRDEPLYNMVGDKGRKTIVRDTNIREYIDLSTNNSVDCRGAAKGVNGIYESILINTPKGAQMYINKLWKSILSEIVRSGYKRANVISIAMLGGNMFVGNRIVNLDGILGGYEEIKLRDIVNFRILFKKFFMLKRLIVDEDMLRAAVLELGDIAELFRLGHKIEKVVVQKTDGSAVLIDRLDLEIDKEDRSVLEKQGKSKNEFDVFCAANRGIRWYDNIASKNIWGMKLAKKYLSGAGELFFKRDKPKLGRAMLLTGSGITVGAVGTIAWGLARGLTGIYDLATRFRK